MFNRFRYELILCSFLLLAGRALSQGQPGSFDSFLTPADTLDKARFWSCLGLGTVLYGSAAVGLYEAWYKDFELSNFHTFNDLSEWKQMDKMGHLFTAYLESRLSYKGARWTGMDRRTAAWTGVGVGMLLQSTIEIMDGFSEKWGFSWSDMGFNALGAGLFLSQEMLWQEQRILIKVSNSSPRYSTAPVFANNSDAISSIAQRAEELYGRSFAETFLKDYNGLTVWASINPDAFLKKGNKKSRWPDWLNIAIGYSGENLYGGFDNSWEDESGNAFSLSAEDFPRYRQFYLSFDIDVDRLPSRSPVLRTMLTLISWIKVPAPSLEFNTLGQVKFHPFFW